MSRSKDLGHVFDVYIFLENRLQRVAGKSVPESLNPHKRSRRRHASTGNTLAMRINRKSLLTIFKIDLEEASKLST